MSVAEDIEKFEVQTSEFGGALQDILYLTWNVGIRVICGKGKSLRRFAKAMKAASGGCVGSKQLSVQLK